MSALAETVMSADGTLIPIAVEGRTDAATAYLMLHGLTTSKDEYAGVFLEISQRLLKHDVTSVRMDFRGHGASDAPVRDFDLSSQITDVLNIIRWCADALGISTVSILAASFGAPSAIFSARLLPTRVNKLVLIAPVLEFEKTFLEPTTEWGRSTFGLDRICAALDSDELLVQGEDQVFRFSRRFATDLLVSDPVRSLTRLHCPVKIFHGDVDGMVPFEASADVARTNPTIRFHPLQRTEHGLFEAGDENGQSARSQENYELVLKEMVE